MHEDRARRVVDGLRTRGVDAQMARPGVYQFGVSVTLGDGREAVWDTDGSAGLEAQVLRDGVLVGFVPVIEGSADFDEGEVIDAIAAADYDEPVGRVSVGPAPTRASLPPQGGVLRRLFDGFRYR